MKNTSIFLGRRRAFKNLLFWFVTMGALAIVAGQNCGRQDWNSTSGTPLGSGNNGGLYGGLTAENGGGYQAEVASGFGGSDPNSELIADTYILARRGGTCDANPMPLSLISVSTIIQGIISPYGAFTYARESLCSPALPYTPGQLSLVDFDHRVGIASDQIYFFYGQAPLAERFYKFPVAHCRAVTSIPYEQLGGIHSLDLGITVSLYMLNGQLMAEVARGMMVGTTPTKYFVQPFSVAQEITQAESKFTQGGFELKVARNGLAVTTGRIVTNIDRQPITTNMNCWVENP